MKLIFFDGDRHQYFQKARVSSVLIRECAKIALVGSSKVSEAKMLFSPPYVRFNFFVKREGLFSRILYSPFITSLRGLDGDMVFDKNLTMDFFNRIFKDTRVLEISFDGAGKKLSVETDRFCVDGDSCYGALLKSFIKKDTDTFYLDYCGLIEDKTFEDFVETNKQRFCNFKTLEVTDIELIKILTKFANDRGVI